jgi:hypothetical protein
MKRTLSTCILLTLSLGWTSASAIAQPQTDDKKPAVVSIDPNQTDEDFTFQGEYVGALGMGDQTEKYGLQIIALGNGKFKSVGYHGGLPGDGYNGEEPVRSVAEGTRNGDQVIFAGDKHGTGTIQNGTITVVAPDGTELGKLKKVTRESKTLGMKPPAEASVLFDGSNADGWKNGRIDENGWLQQGTTSNATFGDHQIHIEFLLPYKPAARGQGRGNSGIYLQGRYEVQMLDSFGLEGKDNECGGIYSVGKPAVNMCFPPLSWQTYDIDFTTAQYENKKLVTPPRVTVRHNGVVIHDDIELPGNRGTTASPLQAGPEPGPIYLQNHGNPVRYRNIWVVPEK